MGHFPWLHPLRPPRRVGRPRRDAFAAVSVERLAKADRGFVVICGASELMVSIDGGTPRAGWFTVEHPIKIDDLGIPPFQETSIYIILNSI